MNPQTNTPTVTFLVPCYNLAHYLKECVDSILAQTYQDFEILILDDCSPDNTSDVAKSFEDPRVRYIRNEPNLGHLRNYNKGISLARGHFVWLISADDKLRRDHVLQRYMELMKSHPEVGFAFCPGYGLLNGRETELLKYSYLGAQDKIFKGTDFFLELLKGNRVLAVAGIVRKSCYDEISVFPLDLPFSGDWYLWLIFALHQDVAYFAEPMVYYREHELSMTNSFVGENVRICSEDEIATLWRIHDRVKQCGNRELETKCEEAIVNLYAAHISYRSYKGSRAVMSLDELVASVRKYAPQFENSEYFKARVLAAAADHCYWKADHIRARSLYWSAIRQNPRSLTVWSKYILVLGGKLGSTFRQSFSRVRRGVDKVATRAQ